MRSSLGQAVQTQVVDREPLLRRLLQSHARSIRIVAPAGYGKSRLARQLAERLGCSEPADCRDIIDVNSGVRVLLRALGPFAPEFDERVSRHIVALKRHPSDDERWTDLLDEALARRDGSTWLWLENAEEVANSTVAGAVVERVLRDSRRGAIICSRVDLQLPALTRIPPNETYRVSIHDLKFTDAECAQLFDCDTPPDLRDRAIQLANGWPIAALTFSRARREHRLADMIAAASEGGALQDFDAYTLKEALGILSEDAKRVLAAVSLLGRAGTDEIALLADEPDGVLAELYLCPLALHRDGAFEAHPLAASALSPLRDIAREKLRASSSRVSEPLRAAQFAIAAGDGDAAASILDGALSLFMHGKMSAELAEVVGAIDGATLARHPATWCSTVTPRVYAISPEEYLAEARTAYANVALGAPVQLRIGVGLSLINSLLLFFDLTDEALELLNVLEAVATENAADALTLAMIGMWRMFALFRRGVAFDEAVLSDRLMPAVSALPLIAAASRISLYGPAAHLRGDREGCRRAFSSAAEMARNAESVTYEVLALCNGAFYAWLAGEELLFKQSVVALRERSEPSVWHGTRHFIACATEPRPGSAPVGFETRYSRAFGLIIAAARETDGARRRAAARAAVDAATASGEAWLIALSRLCLGLCDASVRGESFEQAVDQARRVQYPAFSENVAAVVAGRIPPLWSALNTLRNEVAFEGLRLRMGSCEIEYNGNSITVSRREMELLLALALSKNGYDRGTLAAMIWTDSGEADGANAVTVNISRLRKRLADAALIEAGPYGYRLAGEVDLDLLHLERWSHDGTAEPLGDPSLEHVVSSGTNRLPQWILVSDWLAPFVRRYEMAIDAIRKNRLRQAIEQGNAAEVSHYRRLIEAEDREG